MNLKQLRNSVEVVRNQFTAQGMGNIVSAITKVDALVMNIF